MTSSVGSKVVKKGKRYVKKYLKGKSAWDVAKIAWNGVKYLKGLVNAELHTNDVYSTSTLDYTNGVVVAINQIAQGDTSTDRNGKSILMKYISMRGIVYRNSANQNETIRLMIVMDTSGQGTAPVLSDILALTGSTGAPLSNLNKFANGRFKILWTRTFVVDNTTASQVFKAFIPIAKHVKFDGPNATDYQKNAMFLVGCSDQTGANLPSYHAYIRQAFYDN